MGKENGWPANRRTSGDGRSDNRALAKECAQIPHSMDVEVIVYPKPKSTWERIIEMQQNGDIKALKYTLKNTIAHVQSIAQKITELGLFDSTHALEIPDIPKIK